MINIIHKEKTDEEAYRDLKEFYKEDPSIFMSPKTWKRLRLIQLKKEGRIWSN